MLNEPEVNPYSVSSEIDNASQVGYATVSGEPNWINQVSVVAILQIVLGSLELLIGLALIVFSFLMPSIFAKSAEDSGKPLPEEFVMWMTVMYAGFGVVLGLSAAMRIVSGIYAFWFKGRMFLLTSLFFGLVSVFTCYCSPFSIGVAIYGAIVLFNGPVREAFRLSAQGKTVSDIRSVIEQMSTTAARRATSGYH